MPPRGSEPIGVSSVEAREFTGTTLRRMSVWRGCWQGRHRARARCPLRNGFAASLPFPQRDGSEGAQLGAVNPRIIASFPLQSTLARTRLALLRSRLDYDATERGRMARRRRLIYVGILVSLLSLACDGVRFKFARYPETPVVTAPPAGLSSTELAAIIAAIR